MSEDNLLVKLVKKSVGLPTGKSDCCGAPAASQSNGCCDSSDSSSCCGTENAEQTSTGTSEEKANSTKAA